MSKATQAQSLQRCLRPRTIGCCIYCGATQDLTDEHVIPYALNGTYKLDKASCRPCACITSAFEGRVVGQMLGPSRHVLRVRTRRGKKREQQSSYPMLFRKDGREVKENVPVQDYVATIPAPFFGYPEHQAARLRAQGQIVPTGLLTVGVAALQREDASSPGELVKRHRAEKISVQMEFHWQDYARLLAKIAYGYTIAKFGFENIAACCVLDSILGRSDDVLRWVGCQGLDRRLPVHQGVNGIYHNIGLEVDNGEFIARIRLFDNIENAVEYTVFVGRATDGLRAVLRSVGNEFA